MQRLPKPKISQMNPADQINTILTKYLFEINNQKTRDKIIAEIHTYQPGIPVTCDETNNTEEVLRKRMLRIEIDSQLYTLSQSGIKMENVSF